MDLVMSWIFLGLVGISLGFSLAEGTGGALSAAVAKGAQDGITLSVSMAGALCLWSGVGKLMEKAGITGVLARLLSPLLGRLFPDTKKDPVLSGYLSGNVCANLLGLGNAATPLGVQAARRLAGGRTTANNQLCRLIVLNTASIQLIPTTVAAVRAAAGSASPFDILPAVWVTSLCSAGAGVTAAWLLGKVWPDD